MGFMGGFSSPGSLTPLTFRTGSTHPTGLTFHTIRIPERDVSFRTLLSFVLTTFKIGEDKLGDKFFFSRYGSQVTQMISHNVFLAGRTMVFSATMVFFLSLGRIDDFVTCQALPLRFALRSSFIFCTMSLVTLFGPAHHMTFLTRYRFFRFGAVRRFTHDTRHFALVSLFVVVMFEAGRTKEFRRKKSCDTGNSMIMAIVHQVEVDARSLVGTRTHDEFITQSSAHHHYSNVQGFLERLYVVQTRRPVLGYPGQFTEGHRQVFSVLFWFYHEPFIVTFRSLSMF